MTGEDHPLPGITVFQRTFCLSDHSTGNWRALACPSPPGPRHSGTDPITAYREGLEVIRDAAGDAYLLGCGAPILPSVGLLDAMRVSPDTAPEWEPPSGDLARLC